MALFPRVEDHDDRKLNLVYMTVFYCLWQPRISKRLLQRIHTQRRFPSCVSLCRVRLQPSNIRLLSGTPTTGAVGVAQKTDKHKKAKPFDKVTNSQWSLNDPWGPAPISTAWNLTSLSPTIFSAYCTCGIHKWVCIFLLGPPRHICLHMGFYGIKLCPMLLRRFWLLIAARSPAVWSEHASAWVSRPWPSTRRRTRGHCMYSRQMR